MVQTYRIFGGVLGVAVAAAAGVSASGCMAWSLAGRGVSHEGNVLSYTLEMAPVDLPAAGGHHGGPQPAPLQIAAPFDGWIHAYSWDVVGPDGEAVPREVLHHMKLTAPNRRELFNQQMLRIAGAGSETGAVELPTQVGYRIHRGDPLLLTAMLHNPAGAALEDVRVRVHLEYSPEGPWRDPLSAYPFFAQVTEPGVESSYDLPPGRSERSIILRPAVSGSVLGFGGHVHQYGKELRVEDAVTSEVLWRTSPITDSSGAVLRVPSDLFVTRGGIPLEAGHAYRFIAVYDNPTGSIIPGGGMATLGGLFDPDEPWPEADTSHPVYTWDMQKEMGSQSKQGEHTGHDGGA
jgi:hypothetical protein